jgi:uncharacterized cupin superfamily protein
MSDLQAIRFEPKGPGGQLELWPEISADALVAGKPVQHGHNYFTDPTGVLTAGVWDCTPMTTKLEPYSVNEFMWVLEGSVTIVDAKGHEETIRAGEAFFIPKGLPCSWKQSEYIRKFYVIFDDPSGMKPQNPETLKVLKFDRNKAMAPMTLPDTTVFNGPVPTQNVFNYFSDMTGQMTAGIWDCTPMNRKAMPFPRNELMCILEGSVTITDDKGRAQTFRAGDTFFIPQGLVNSWHSTEYVRKFYCIYQPKVAAAKANAAE